MVTFKQVAKINALFWLGWTIFYAAVVKIQVAEIPNYWAALFNSATNVLPLFGLSLLVWPLCKRLDWRNMSPWATGFLHFFLANAYTILWQFISFGTLYLIMGESLFTIMDVRMVAGWQYPQGILIYLMVAGIYYTLLFYYEVKERELRESKLLLSLRESEWKALKAQINPHFLFNALNSVSALISQDSNKAREMLVKLSTLLRRALSENPLQTTPLENELSFTHHYLELEKIRLGDRLTYSEEISPESTEVLVPVMFLQPLIENAIKHGINPTANGGELTVKITMGNKRLTGSIINSTPKQRTNTDSGSGINNLKNRLSLLYGNAASLETNFDSAQRTFTANFQFPLNVPEEVVI